MIEAARNEMIPRLKQIWKDCFHDEEEYIDFYYRERFPQVETLVNTVDGVPAAMVTLVPAKLINKKTSINLRYVYAVATAPAYQGRGLAAELMNEIKGRVGKEYDAVFLVPATKELFQYYAKFGYETVCEKKIITVSLDEENGDRNRHGNKTDQSKVCFEPLTAFELYTMREQRFSDIGYVAWDVTALDYLIREYELCLGKAVKVRTSSATGSLFYYYNQENKVLYIKETSISFRELQPVLRELSKLYKVEHFEVIVPSSSELTGHTVPFAMGYGAGINHLHYANFVKD